MQMVASVEVIVSATIANATRPAYAKLARAKKKVVTAELTASASTASACLLANPNHYLS